AGDKGQQHGVLEDGVMVAAVEGVAVMHGRHGAWGVQQVKAMLERSGSSFRTEWGIPGNPAHGLTSFAVVERLPPRSKRPCLSAALSAHRRGAGTSGMGRGRRARCVPGDKSLRCPRS